MNIVSTSFYTGSVNGWSSSIFTCLVCSSLCIKSCIFLNVVNPHKYEFSSVRKNKVLW